MKTSAEDIRHSLRICFQPAITSDAELLGKVIDNLATDFVEGGVTQRRLVNACQVVAIDADHLDRLIVAMITKGGK